MFMQNHFFNPFGRFLHVRPLPCLLMNKWVNRAHIVRIPNQAFVTPNRLSYIKLVYRAVFFIKSISVTCNFNYTKLDEPPQFHPRELAYFYQE